MNTESFARFSPTGVRCPFRGRIFRNQLDAVRDSVNETLYGTFGGKMKIIGVLCILFEPM
jgi:hypothetical protein